MVENALMSDRHATGKCPRRAQFVSEVVRKNSSTNTNRIDTNGIDKPMAVRNHGIVHPMGSVNMFHNSTLVHDSNHWDESVEFNWR